MSYFKRHEVPGAPEGEPQTEVLPSLQTDAPNEDPEQQRPSTAARVAGFRSRIAGALQGFDKPRITYPNLRPGTTVREEDHARRPAPEQQEPSPHEVVAEVPPRSEDSHFPIGPLGYHRSAVDERIAELEEELEHLRGLTQPMSLNEEIERLGEQTASILIVAHDQANETTRRAQEQADQCIADAAANAVKMTEKAKRQLQELDNETDSVWQERQRLLDDAREVGLALIALAEEGMERFPGEGSERLSGEGTGRSPEEGTGSSREERTGSSPVEGTGSSREEGAESSPVEGTASSPVEGTGSSPVEGTGSSPIEGMERFPEEGTGRLAREGVYRFPGDGFERFQEMRHTTGPEQ